MKIGKNYQTGLSESHRTDLQPNGKVVRCVEDKVMVIQLLKLMKMQNLTFGQFMKNI